MASNKATTLKIKNNKGKYIPIYPETSKSQVIGWDVGEVQGPITQVLRADNWVNNIQYVDGLIGPGKDAVYYCNKVLSGTKEEMQAQKDAYNDLDLMLPVDDKVGFRTSKVPNVDITVTIWAVY